MSISVAISGIIWSISSVARRKCVGGSMLSALRVSLVLRRLLSPQFVPLFARLAGALEDIVVDVCHVLHIRDGPARTPQHARERIEDDIGEGMAHVRRVVRRHAADVETNRLAVRREGLDLP